jgi:hypothetical protein
MIERDSSPVLNLEEKNSVKPVHIGIHLLTLFLLYEKIVAK